MLLQPALGWLGPLQDCLRGIYSSKAATAAAVLSARTLAINTLPLATQVRDQHLFLFLAELHLHSTVCMRCWSSYGSHHVQQTQTLQQFIADAYLDYVCAGSAPPVFLAFYLHPAHAAQHLLVQHA